jgi:2,4-dienoyl-CoA reductase-like NADH-dependent reductase (Old Yellow Enzyme family)/NADPH-dependent 2,4-dienoyl-CoA reductase/sulfur reductase-like enzyme
VSAPVEIARHQHPRVWQPITVGTIELDHRLVVPPHGGGNGNLMGTDDDFEQHVALWMAKVHGGMRWIGGGPNFVRNPLPVGFEPTGVGAHGPGFFRHPLYGERMAEFASRVHAAGGYLSVQMVLQGGMPIGSSATFSGFNDHRIAHELDLDEVRWLVAEYGDSAAIAIDAGVDAIEIHANHDDIVQWFLSPLTNHRTDVYGGGFDGRSRMLREIVADIRAKASRPFTFGLRLCMDELIDGGFGVDECMALMERFTRDATIDYFSLDVGNNWGAPSYIPIGWHGDHEWSSLCGQAKQATHLPVVYAGRVLGADHAERVLAAGEADLVAMARATMADPELVAKTAAGHASAVRPCIGLNECIHRKLVDGLTYACGVNPHFARERVVRPTRSDAPREVLVVGGGPGGSEFAGLAAEHGHRVRLWERDDHLGGAFAVAARLRGNHRYANWIEYQAQRLVRAGVAVEFGRTATAEAVLASGADLVVVATGARPRTPPTPGVDQPHVVQAGAVITGAAAIGRRVALVVEDDGPAPITVADHLAGLGHEVTMVFQTPAPAPLVGKYSVGAMLARLDLGGVRLVALARVVGIDGDELTLAHSYSGRRWTIGGFDSVVLACGGVGDDALYRDLKHRHPDVRLLGDAFAPRRMVFATRQAWELALSLP